VESGLKLQTDSLTYAIDYIKTYMTDYVAGNELNADFYAYVYRDLTYYATFSPEGRNTHCLVCSCLQCENENRKKSIKLSFLYNYKTTVIFIHMRSQGVASLPYKCQPSLPSDRQHPSYGDCLEVKGKYCQSCSVLGCVTQCSQSAAHLYEQFLQVQQIGFVTLGPLRHA